MFPEAYESSPKSRHQDIADEWADFLKTPVLIGVDSDGYQLAVYRHPAPKAGETRTHVYVKHSSARRLAYEWPGYTGASDPMFQPICLNGHRLGVQICHDMYYGLISQQLRRAGSDVLIDLTGGNVVIAKWKNVVQARSLEDRGHFLCTMGYDPSRSGKAAAIAYQNGRCVTPILDTTGANGVGGYAVFAIDSRPTHDEESDIRDTQGYTNMKYSDIRLSLGTGKMADVVVKMIGGSVHVDGPRQAKRWGQWRGFGTKAGRMGVLPMPLAGLADGSLVHRLDVPENVFDHHVLLYHAQETPSSPASVLSLMKLRAIEHRAAVAVLAGDYREVVKTNNYKSIQRFYEHERDGVFGLNADCMGGTWATAGRDSRHGIPRQWFARYRDLLEPMA